MEHVQLPEHWIIRKSKSRAEKIYYFNTLTGESMWQLPKQQSTSADRSAVKTKQSEMYGRKPRKDGISANSKTIAKTKSTPAQTRLENLQKQLQHADEYSRHSDSGIARDIAYPSSSTGDVGLPTVHSSIDTNTGINRQQSKGLTHSSTAPKNTLKQLQKIVNAVTLQKPISIHQNKNSFELSISAKTPAQSRMKHLQRVISTNESIKFDNNLADLAPQPGQSPINVDKASTGYLSTSSDAHRAKRNAASAGAITKISHGSKAIGKKVPSPNKKAFNIQDRLSIAPCESVAEVSDGQSTSGMKSIFNSLTNYAKKLIQTVTTGSAQSASEQMVDTDVEMDGEKYVDCAPNDDVDMDWETTDAFAISDIITKMRSTLDTELVCNGINVYSNQNNNVALKTIVVADTNIFMNMLLCIREILERDEPIGILVPYMVLQELDKLKLVRNKKNVSILARQAIRFINEQFNKKNDRFQGQGAIDHNRHLIQIDVADDKILNCCLQVKPFTNRVILLSNDINLTNKAKASGIEAVPAKEIKQTLSITQ